MRVIYTAPTSRCGTCSGDGTDCYECEIIRSHVCEALCIGEQFAAIKFDDGRLASVPLQCIKIIGEATRGDYR